MSALKHISSSAVRDFMNKENLSIVPVIGDGLCLFRAVEMSLKRQGIRACTCSSLRTMVSKEVADKWIYYEPFCVATKTRSMEDLDAYICRGKFDQTIADICVAAVFNTLGVTLVICEETNTEVSKIVHPPGRVPTRYTVTLLRSGSANGRTSSEHYDALLVRSPASPAENESCTPTVVHKLDKLRKAPTIPEMFKNHAVKKPKVQETVSMQAGATDVPGCSINYIEEMSELLDSPSHVE